MPPVNYHYGEFPPKRLDWDRLIPLLSTTSSAVAHYNALLIAIPNAQVLLSPLMTQEAVLSSKIEGTVATMEEVLEYEAGAEREMNEPKKEDIREVINYRRAVHVAEEKLKEIPLTSRLIREAHGILMEGVRGRTKDPGNFRRGENWIGPSGCSKEEARFWPIEPQKLNDGISLWEKYLHSTQPDPLVQLAIVHAEFEALHPFLDGNGRLGRMLIPLYLFERKLLSSPNFYMSAYFESHRDIYYDQLLYISQNKDWTKWCEFFLKALKEQAEINTRKAKEIIDLYQEKKNWAMENLGTYAIKALDFIFKRPIFAGSDFVNLSGIPTATAQRNIRTMREKGLLKVLREAAGRSPAILIFPELLSIAEGREIL